MSRKRKYPYLWDTETFLENGSHDPSPTVVGHQNKLDVQFYKGSVLISAEDRHSCVAVWLDGEDLDELIKDLQARVKRWKAAYARARRKCLSDLKKGTLTPDSRGNTPGGAAIRKKHGYRGRVKGAVNGKTTIVKAAYK